MKKMIAVILAAAAILLGVNMALFGTTANNAQAHHLWLLHTLLPDSGEFTLVYENFDDSNIEHVHKADNGYVIDTVTQGYAGPIRMCIGVSNAGKVTGLVVTDMSETYGLGREALTDVDFLKQFLNSSGAFEVASSGADAFSGATGEAETEEGETVSVDALTGATVTSKAIVRSVNSAVSYVTGADTASAATSWGG